MPLPHKKGLLSDRWRYSLLNTVGPMVILAGIGGLVILAAYQMGSHRAPLAQAPWHFGTLRMVPSE